MSGALDDLALLEGTAGGDAESSVEEGMNRGMDRLSGGSEVNQRFSCSMLLQSDGQTDRRETDRQMQRNKDIFRFTMNSLSRLKIVLLQEA